MIWIKKLLVPVDFSEASKKAVTYGLTLAGQFDAQVIIAHIVPESSALTYAFPTETSDTEKEQYERARRNIDKLVAASHRARVNLERIVKIGAVEDQLLGIVKDEAVDLVVMGTHGRRYVGRWFIGSITEHMLRKVPVPVLTVSHVGAQPHEIGLVSLRRILYATDLSESSNTGLKLSMDFANQTEADLTVVHVIDDEGRMFWNSALIAPFDRTEFVAETRKKLNDLIAHETIPGLRVEALVVEGKPFRKIIEVAEDRGVDIIVLNLQSKSLWERALLGATAERVVRLSHTPVLSVPAVFSPQDVA
jgi:nucleotide-binding universal stress UspA family protein